MNSFFSLRLFFKVVFAILVSVFLSSIPKIFDLEGGLAVFIYALFAFFLYTIIAKLFINEIAVATANSVIDAKTKADNIALVRNYVFDFDKSMPFGTAILGCPLWSRFEWKNEDSDNKVNLNCYDDKGNLKKIIVFVINAGKTNLDKVVNVSTVIAITNGEITQTEIAKGDDESVLKEFYVRN